MPDLCFMLALRPTEFGLANKNQEDFMDLKESSPWIFYRRHSRYVNMESILHGLSNMNG
jgi:hypothetical protein